jgi:hypothetical protein
VAVLLNPKMCHAVVTRGPILLEVITVNGRFSNRLFEGGIESSCPLKFNFYNQLGGYQVFMDCTPRNK